jgi:uncharacterized membrane protein
MAPADRYHPNLHLTVRAAEGAVFLLLVFLHVVSMFAAVAVSYGPLAVLQLAIRRGETQTVRAVTASARVVTLSIPFFYVIGAIFGVLAAFNANFNLLAPWLVISYVLFLVLMIIGAAVIGPWAERIGKVAAASPDGPFSPELQTIVTDQRVRLLRGVDGIAIVLLIFDMVVKPFS